MNLDENGQVETIDVSLRKRIALFVATALTPPVMAIIFKPAYRYVSEHENIAFFIPIVGVIALAIARSNRSVTSNRKVVEQLFPEFKYSVYVGFGLMFLVLYFDISIG